MFSCPRKTCCWFLLNNIVMCCMWWWWELIIYLRSSKNEVYLTLCYFTFCSVLSIDTIHPSVYLCTIESQFSCTLRVIQWKCIWFYFCLIINCVWWWHGEIVLSNSSFKRIGIWNERAFFFIFVRHSERERWRDEKLVFLSVVDTRLSVHFVNMWCHSNKIVFSSQYEAGCERWRGCS